MVDKIHYRWDFVGLSTDTPKPTASTSPKVVDGSTYYEADTSKLYVWYNDQWYEKEDLYAGIPTTVVDNIWFGTQDEYNAISPKAAKTLYLVKESVPSVLELNDSRQINQSLDLKSELELNKSTIEFKTDIEEETAEEHPTESEE